MGNSNSTKQQKDAILVPPPNIQRPLYVHQVPNPNVQLGRAGIKLNPQNPKNKKQKGKNSYHLFEEVLSLHKKPPQKYNKKNLKPIINIEPEEAHDYYAPSFIPSNDFENNRYMNSDFSDPEYRNEIPKRKDQKGVLKIDTTKTMFFRGGHFSFYSDAIFVFDRLAGTQSFWVDIEDPQNQVLLEVKFPAHLQKLLSGEPIIRKYLMQAGWFIAENQKWGFLLNLQSISEAYNGFLHTRWEKLLLQPFFIGIFERFSEYMEELNSQNKKGHIPREIPSTECDPLIPQGYLNLTKPLYLHQMQEVGWMHSFEKYPAISIPKKQHALQFLDTGYYLDPEKKNQLMKINKDSDFVDFILPGGVLASQIGSGKTATIVALTSIGSKFDKKDKSEEERSERYKPTLIIVTKNILQQWADEYEKFAPHMKVAVLETEGDLEGKNFKGINVILTHRNIIENWALMERICPKIFEISYKRVVIDEVHELTMLMNEQYGGNARVVQGGDLDTLHFFKGLVRFQRECTWGVTGTPDNLNYFDEATPLLLLLNLSEGLKQTSSYSKIKDMIVTTCMRKNPRSVDLPKLEKSLQKLYFGQLQNILYKGKLNYALNKYAAQEICSNLLPQWEKIQAVDHLAKAIAIVQEKQNEEIKNTIKKIEQKSSEEKNLLSKLQILQSEDNFFNEVIKLISQESFECPLCLEQLSDKRLVVTDCLHNLCVECYEGLINKVQNAQCPVCREEIQKNRLLLHPKFTNETNKLSSIVDAVRKTPEEDKIIIFTQFHSLVGHLSKMFSELGIAYTVLRGEPSEINMSLSNFKRVPEIKILLMSIEQCASGINVPEANHVFFAHPIFGMNFEKAALTYNQCIGRAYRIGQKKPVDVKLFVTMESLEEDLIPTFYKYSNTLN